MTDDARDSEPAPPAGPASARTLVLGVGVTVLVLLAAGALAVSGANRAQEASQPPTVDDAPQTLADRVDPTETAPLPDASLAAFAGQGERSTSDYRGTPLVLNFWASWCAPCVEEMPAFQEIADAGQGRLAVLGVNLQDDLDKAAALVDSLGISYDLAVDPDGDLFADVEAFGMPTTLFVDPDGQIRFRHTGPLDAEELAGLLADHLGVEVSSDP